MYDFLELSLNSYYQRLPEPPEVRGNLKKEIQLFVTALNNDLKMRGENNIQIFTMATGYKPTPC